jgi:hypothetical protein
MSGLFFRTRAEREVDFPSERLALDVHRTNVCQPGGGDLSQELHDGTSALFGTRCAGRRNVVGAVHEILERVMDLLTLGELVP